MPTNVNLPVDQMVLLSGYYPGICSHVVKEQGESKARRIRKKSKGEGESSGMGKRKLTEEQVKLLEMSFGDEHKLESERKDRLATELGLDPRQVAVWFQNRRARWKSKKLEEEYSKLKAEHDTAMVEKCRLENEVLKLKEQLSEADKEIQMLLEHCDGLSISSPNSSFSMEALEPHFLGGFGMEGLEKLIYGPENNYNTNGLEWVNLHNM